MLLLLVPPPFLLSTALFPAFLLVSSPALAPLHGSFSLYFHPIKEEAPSSVGLEGRASEGVRRWIGRPLPFLSSFLYLPFLSFPCFSFLSLLPPYSSFLLTSFPPFSVLSVPFLSLFRPFSLFSSLPFSLPSSLRSLPSASSRSSHAKT